MRRAGGLHRHAIGRGGDGRCRHGGRGRLRLLRLLRRRLDLRRAARIRGLGRGLFGAAGIVAGTVAGTIAGIAVIACAPDRGLGRVGGALGTRRRDRWPMKRHPPDRKQLWRPACRQRRSRRFLRRHRHWRRRAAVSGRRRAGKPVPWRPDWIGLRRARLRLAAGRRADCHWRSCRFGCGLACGLRADPGHRPSQRIPRRRRPGPEFAPARRRRQLRCRLHPPCWNLSGCPLRQGSGRWWPNRSDPLVVVCILSLPLEDEDGCGLLAA